jgi:hypothetical protein
MQWFRVGIVMQYFDNISVAVIQLDDMLQLGDWVGFVDNNDLLFEQEIFAMQIQNGDVDRAEPGELVGVQVEQPVIVGAEVYVAGE